jgi:hypothetical protein
MRLDLKLAGALFSLVFFLPSCSGSSHTNGVSPPSDTSVATASIGPIAVAAGEEKTVCIVKALDNAEDIVATSFISDLAPGSHHLIFYRSAATAEQLTPTTCNPFEGLLGGDVPLVIVTRGHLEYDLPSGVGIKLAKGQLLKIEAHYINTTSAPIQGVGSVQVKGTPLATAGSFQAADVGLWGTSNISVPAQSSFTTPVNFQKGIAGTKIFALTTHEHHLGTQAQVWASAQAGDVAHPIANDTDWANPAFVTFQEPLTMDGTNGLSYQCAWKNPTDTAVSFGESALNEMCFAIFYYYPSHGTDICLDGCSR